MSDELAVVYPESEIKGVFKWGIYIYIYDVDKMSKTTTKINLQHHIKQGGE